MWYHTVTSVKCGGAVYVSGDEGRLLFPHGVIPHPPDSTLRAHRRTPDRKGKRRKRCGEKRSKTIMRKGRKNSQAVLGQCNTHFGRKKTPTTISKGVMFKKWAISMEGQPQKKKLKTTSRKGIIGGIHPSIQFTLQNSLPASTA